MDGVGSSAAKRIWHRALPREAKKEIEADPMAEPTRTQQSRQGTAPEKEKSGSSPGRPVARRAFLTGASAVAAATGYATLAPGEPEKARTGDPPSDPRKVSYRETDHIRQFYARARF